MKELIEMTYRQIEALNKENAIVCITVAPIEEHSHHLPIGTDLFEGEHWIQTTAERIEQKEPDLEIFHLPPLTVASASARYPYSIHYAPDTVRQVVTQMLEGVVGYGFRNIIVIASHGDPIHHIAIEGACDDINGKYGIRAISPLGSLFSLDHKEIPFAVPEDISRLEGEMSDIHAGFVETSSMMDINPALVQACFKDLPDTKISDRDMGNQEKLLQAMGEYGHLGAPRLATPELGRRLTNNVADFLEQAIMAFVHKDSYEQYMHHFLFGMSFWQHAFNKNGV